MMGFRNAWITVWTMVGVIDSTTVQVLGPVLAFVIGGLGLLVNYRISSRANSTAVRIEEQKSADLVRQIDLVNKNLELARFDAADEAAKVRAELATARDELAEMNRVTAEDLAAAAREQAADLTHRVDDATDAASKAYTEANDVNRKLAEVTQVALIHQDANAKAILQKNEYDVMLRVANTKAIDDNTVATDSNTDIRKEEHRREDADPRRRHGDRT